MKTVLGAAGKNRLRAGTDGDGEAGEEEMELHLLLKWWKYLQVKPRMNGVKMWRKVRNL